MAEELHLWRLIDGSYLSSDTQRDIFVLGVSPIQVTHPLIARLPPEVQEAVSNGVIFKHDVVHMSIFLGGHHATFLQQEFCVCDMRSVYPEIQYTTIRLEHSGCSFSPLTGFILQKMQKSN